MLKNTFVERIIASVGSATSLGIHTLLFVLCFVSALFHLILWDTMLLVLTTLVSLEAIYLAIFIQMSVNRHTIELAEVSDDVEDIQEDIEEISQDVDEIQKDVGEIQENVEEITDEDGEEVQHEKRQTVAIEQLTKDVQRVLKDLEQLKKKGL